MPWLCRQSDPVGWLCVQWEVHSTTITPCYGVNNTTMCAASMACPTQLEVLWRLESAPCSMQSFMCLSGTEFLVQMTQNRSQASSPREPHPAKRTYSELTKGSHHCHVTITSSRVMQDSALSPLNHEPRMALSLSNRH